MSDRSKVGARQSDLQVGGWARHKVIADTDACSRKERSTD